jgi:hypothetical protein
MDGLLEPSLGTQEDRESSRRPIMVAVAAVVVVVAIILLVSQATHKTAAAPHPYAANLKISDLKLSAAENFAGFSVTYVDGTVINAGGKTVTRAVVHVVFKNSMSEIAQAEDMPVQILQTTGPYPDTIDLKASPLAPGQSKQFRLTFEHVSADWDQSYPQVQVTDVTVQ